MHAPACAFTGHRLIRFSFGYDESDERCVKLKRSMAEWISALIDRGVRTFYTGMDIGVDQWAASIVLDKQNDHPDVRLIAVLSCEMQANDWSLEDRELYFDMLALCNDVITLNTRFTRSCIYERNRYLVDHAEYLLAVYNGSEKGSAAYTVQQGKQKSCQIIMIHPDTLEVSTTTGIETFRRRGRIYIVKGTK